MKVSNKSRIKDGKTTHDLSYLNWPTNNNEHTQARIEEWDNGEGCDIWLGDIEIQLTHQEITVLEILFANVRLLK